VLAGKHDDLAIAVSGLFVLTASLVHHARAIVTVVHFRSAFAYWFCQREIRRTLGPLLSRLKGLYAELIGNETTPPG